MALLEIEGLSVDFAASHGSFRAVDGVSLTVDAGEILSVVGESGSGKSVAMLAVMGLLPWTAKVLRVARRSEPRDLDLEAAPLERIAADLLQITVSPVSRMHGVEIGELRLPRGASVALVVRDGATLAPEPRTVLRHGDDVLVVTPRKIRDRTEQRLRAVSAHGRLARWLG